MNVRRVLAGAGEVVHYGLLFLWAIPCPRAVLAARALAAEGQLAACKYDIAAKKRRRPRFTLGAVFLPHTTDFMLPCRTSGRPCS
jgi:hypothetical protein